jgi:hypothetical protein
MDAGVISVMSSSLGVTPLGPAPESDRGREPGLDLDLAKEPCLELDLAKEPCLELDLAKEPGLELDLAKEPCLELDLAKEPGLEFDLAKEPGLELDLAREPGLELDLASGALLLDRDRDFVLCARHTCKAIKSQTMNQIRILARSEYVQRLQCLCMCAFVIVLLW